MRTVLAFTVLLILTVSNTFSKTDKIEGIIRDGVNNKPLSNTLITLTKNGEVFDNKYTTESGSFAFYRLNSGDYILKFELNDYKTEERKVLITQSNNFTHSFTIYLESSKPVIANVEIKEYPLKSDYEYFLVNHLYKQYNTDSTLVFSSTGECLWNKDHEMLYVGVLHLDNKPNGETEIFETSKLLGAFEVMPDLEKAIALNTDEKKEKKWITLLEKAAESAEKIITQNPGMVIK